MISVICLWLILSRLGKVKRAFPLLSLFQNICVTLKGSAHGGNKKIRVTVKRYFLGGRFFHCFMA